jgi:hypothetical protein
MSTQGALRPNSLLFSIPGRGLGARSIPKDFEMFDMANITMNFEEVILLPNQLLAL